MGPRRFAVVGALCSTAVLAAWVAAELAGLGSPGIKNTGPSFEDRWAISVTSGAEPVDAPRVLLVSVSPIDPVEVFDIGGAPVALFTPRLAPATAVPVVPLASVGTADPVQPDAETVAVEVADMGSFAALPDPGAMPAAAPPVRLSSLMSTADPVQNDANTAAVEAVDMESFAALPDPRALPPAAALPVRLASLSTADPVQNDANTAARPVEILDECIVPDICIDDYLWSLYQRTPKIDATKVSQRIKVTIKKKGKRRTVFKTITKYVDGEFAWKDPIAAQRVGMPLKDYVIGGMDRGFKRKLYRALRAMDDAGFMPGITSAFRDNYRQSIATGNKAASDSSYHGGSRRGGYGRGLAADIVSVRGDTRMQRYHSTRELWKWIDANEKEFGVGRPYLDRDPPHVAPIDGQEYAAKRGRTNVQKAALPTGNAQKARLPMKQRLAMRNDPGRPTAQSRLSR